VRGDARCLHEGSDEVILTAGAGSEAIRCGRELLARDGWSREQLEAYRRTRLESIVRHAVSASPYYREALGPHGHEAPLEELPTLSKATLMDEFDRLVTDPRLTLEHVEAHVAGPDP